MPSFTSPTTDAGANAWLRAAALGDTIAFAHLFLLLRHSVIHQAGRFLVDRAQAEEVAQEVMLEVWLKAGSFDPARGSAQAWVATISRRRALDRCRSDSAMRRRERQHHQEPEPGQDLGELADRRLTHDHVRAALSRLTAVQREAVELTYFAGLTHMAAARMLGIPAGTLKSRLGQAVARLRRDVALRQHLAPQHDHAWQAFSV